MQEYSTNQLQPAPIVSRQLSWIMPIFLVLSFVPFSMLSGPPTESYDDASYLSHAFTLGIDFDFDYNNELSGRLGYWDASGRFAPHPIGPGILSAPFVAVFSLADRIIDHPVLQDRRQYIGSWSYFGFLLSVQAYYAVAIVLLWWSFRGTKVGAPSLVWLLLLSSGIHYYVLVRPTMAHGFELFALSLLVALTTKLRGRRATLVNVVAISLALYLNVLVRYSNVNALILPFVVWLIIAPPRKWKQGVVPLVVAVAIGATATVLHNLVLFGAPIPTISAVYPVSTGSVKSGSIGDLAVSALSNLRGLVPLIFGLEQGLFFTSFLSFVGVFAPVLAFVMEFGRQRRIAISLLSMAYISVPLAIVLLWQTTASDYGFRYLYSAIPLGYVTLVGVVPRFRSLGTVTVRRVLSVLFTVVCVAGMLSVLFYRTTADLSPHPSVNSFGQFHRYSLQRYLPSLIDAVFSWRAWLALVGRTVVGFVAASMVDTSGPLVSSLPDLVPHLDRYSNRLSVSGIVVPVQAVLLSLPLPLMSALMIRRHRHGVEATATHSDT